MSRFVQSDGVARSRAADSVPPGHRWDAWLASMGAAPDAAGARRISMHRIPSSQDARELSCLDDFNSQPCPPPEAEGPRLPITATVGDHVGIQVDLTDSSHGHPRPRHVLLFNDCWVDDRRYIVPIFPAPPSALRRPEGMALNGDRLYVPPWPWSAAQSLVIPDWGPVRSIVAVASRSPLPGEVLAHAVRDWHISLEVLDSLALRLHRSRHETRSEHSASTSCSQEDSTLAEGAPRVEVWRFRYRVRWTDDPPSWRVPPVSRA